MGQVKVYESDERFEGGRPSIELYNRVQLLLRLSGRLMSVSGTTEEQVMLKLNKKVALVTGRCTRIASLSSPSFSFPSSYYWLGEHMLNGPVTLKKGSEHIENEMCPSYM